MKSRIYFLDNLRTFLILLVVVVHSGIVYESVLENIWIVSDPVKNNTIGTLRMYLDIFIMFIMFFISGYFLPQSLNKKSVLVLLKGKFKRIMLPWLIAVLTLIPAYKVIFLYSRNLPQETWYSYLHFFNRAGGNPFSFADNPSMNWLWFLPVLFLFQVVYLGLTKTKLLSINISLTTGVLLTLILGFIYSKLIYAFGLNGWYHSILIDFQIERLGIYFLGFLLGTRCYRIKVFDLKNRPWHFITGTALLAGSLFVFGKIGLNYYMNTIYTFRKVYIISEWVDELLYHTSVLLSMLLFLYFFIQVFRFLFNNTNKYLSRLSAYSYHVYIIHTVVLGLIALILFPISLPAYVKFIILTLLTFVVSNMIVCAYKGGFKKSTKS